MDLQFHRKSTPGVDYSWLASRHGTGNATPATVKFSSLNPSTDLVDGCLPSGFPISLATSGPNEGFAVPYLAGVSDASSLRFVLEPVPVNGNDVAVAALWHGAINVDNLPVPFVAPASGTQFTFIEGAGS